ncbi:hypothetical protein CPB84DRAFT_1757734 [Gymnopilus junonius]|uniref:RING-type domain-containing protein n=1 Tax=Gymnopilus junonius TaxID=109634 RepID=A0A9P5P2X0_GYMJU|nr:hypothetical protein CPB84DRAFT_1757734 [Gymnopilus junonius]
MDPTAAAAYELVQDALLTPHSRINLVLSSLPTLHKNDVDLEEQCPICLMPFASIFAEQDEQAQQILPLSGLTRLGCGHVFCRRDLTEWVRSLHGNCPTCRYTFLNIRAQSDSDDESSDGGEYIPNPEELDDDDEDAFLDSIDSFTEADTDAEDFPVHGMDLDVDGMWAAEETSSTANRDAEMRDEDISEAEVEEDGSSEWGLTDGESESMSSSNGDFSMTAEQDPTDNIAVGSGADINVSVQEDEVDANAAEERGRLVPHDISSDSQDPK